MLCPSTLHYAPMIHQVQLSPTLVFFGRFPLGHNIRALRVPTDKTSLGLC